MKNISLKAPLMFLFVCVAVLGQRVPWATFDPPATPIQQMTNATVVQMVQAKVSPDLIILAISKCEPHFVLDSGNGEYLRQMGVTDEIFKAMAAKQVGRPIPGYTESSTVLAVAARPLVAPAVSAAQPASIQPPPITPPTKRTPVPGQPNADQVEEQATVSAATAPAVPRATAAKPLSTDTTSSHDGLTENQYPTTSKTTRVYVTDSQSWEIRGGWTANRRGGSGYTAGGARPQTSEIIKTINQRCPDLTVTNRVEKADFAITLDHEGGKALLSRHNKLVVFNRDGDDIFSVSTRSLGNSVKDACEAILRNGPPIY